MDCKCSSHRDYVFLTMNSEQLAHFYYHGLDLLPVWIGNYKHYEVRDEITFPFPYLNGPVVDLGERISKYNSHFTHVLIYPSSDKRRHVDEREPEGSTWYMLPLTASNIAGCDTILRFLLSRVWWCIMGVWSLHSVQPSQQSWLVTEDHGEQNCTQCC